jgi:hypothetical protein
LLLLIHTIEFVPWVNLFHDSFILVLEKISKVFGFKCFGFVEIDFLEFVPHSFGVGAQVQGQETYFVAFVKH